MKKTILKNFSKLTITYRALSELKESVHNAHTHSDKKIAKLCRSFKEFGINMPLVIEQDGTILSGHAMYRAAKELGLAEVPTVIIDHLSKAQKRAFMIAVNKIAEESGWDREILKVEFEFLLKEVFDLSITGFEVPEIDLIINDNFIQKEKPEKPDKADALPDESKVPQRVKFGDLWKLGDHYVFCGDSRKEESFKILLGEKNAQMALVDNPYNVPISGHVCGSGKIKHDEFVMASGEMNQQEFTDFLETIFRNLAKYSVNGSWHLHFMDFRHMREILTAGDKVYSELKNLCVWNKMQGGMGSMWRSQHELIFAFKNGTASHVNNIELGKHGRYRTNVWDYKGVSATNPGSLEDLKLHPTVKPVAMLTDAILDCSKPGDIVLDCFGGSGSTLMAAQRTKRQAYLIEYETKYCDVILYRYQKLTGKKPELVNNFGGEINE